MTFRLEHIPKSDRQLRYWMARHYSEPWGFVGRQIIYKIWHDDISYGAIAAGSATLNLPGRADFFGWTPPLTSIVNNTFYHVEKVAGRYPLRNFTSFIVEVWRYAVIRDWPLKYGDQVFGFESLVELPRTGELYVKDGWKEVGQTIGYTCKRDAEAIGGKSTDSWSGRRVWDTKNLRPKRVFMRHV